MHMVWFPDKGCSFLRVVTCAIAVCSSCVLAAEDPSRVEPSQSESSKGNAARYSTRTLTGRVVWAAEALARRHGVQSVPEAADRILAMETRDGQLIPLIEDKRGRSFRLDERLRGIDVELLVRQYEGTTLAQVIQIFALRKDGKYELDYWCDICAIAMFELKPCDCCQGDTELRARKVVQPEP